MEATAAEAAAASPPDTSERPDAATHTATEAVEELNYELTLHEGYHERMTAYFRDADDGATLLGNAFVLIGAVLLMVESLPTWAQVMLMLPGLLVLLARSAFHLSARAQQHARQHARYTMLRAEFEDGVAVEKMRAAFRRITVDDGPRRAAVLAMAYNAYARRVGAPASALIDIRPMDRRLGYLMNVPDERLQPRQALRAG